MNKYLKVLLDICSESLCRNFCVESDYEEMFSKCISVDDIKNILKYRFSMDFDFDLEKIKKSAVKCKKPNEILEKMIISIIEIVDEKVCFDSKACQYMKEIMIYNIRDDNKDKMEDSINKLTLLKLKYIFHNLFLIVINVNDSKTYHYQHIEDLKIGGLTTIVGSEDDEEAYAVIDQDSVNMDKFTKLFIYRFLSSNGQEDNQNGKNTRLKWDWSEALDMTFFASSINIQKNPYFCIHEASEKNKSNKKKKDYSSSYSSKIFEDFCDEYNKVFNLIFEDHKSKIKNTAFFSRRDYIKKYLKSSRYIQQFANSVKEAEEYFSELIYGFNLINTLSKTICDCIGEYENPINEEYENRIYKIASLYMLIPDIYSRQCYVEYYVKYLYDRVYEENQKSFFDNLDIIYNEDQVRIKNTKISENFITIWLDELEEWIKDFCVHQSLIYYPILMTYTLLLLDYLLDDKCDMSFLYERNRSELKDNTEKEEFLLDVLAKCMQSLKLRKITKNEKTTKINRKAQRGECIWEFYKNAYSFFSDEFLDDYINSQIFQLKVDEPELLINSYACYLREDNAKRKTQLSDLFCDDDENEI